MAILPALQNVNLTPTNQLSDNGIPENTRLKLNNEGNLDVDSLQHRTNIFARAWDCLTRSPEKVEANKQLARTFVAELREKYGDEVANMASRELKSHLNLGRPLTAYRALQVYEHVKQQVNNMNNEWITGQEQSVQDIREQFNDDELTLLRRSGLNIQEGRQYKELNAPITSGTILSRQELDLLNEAGLSMEIGLQYKEQQIPIHPRTLIGEYHDGNVQGEPKELRGGAVSKPKEVEYQTESGIKTVVFKEAKIGEGYGDVSGALGIDRNDSRMTTRNVATKIVDELLDFNLVPDTRFGMLNGKLGMVMDFAEGVPALKKEEREITDPMIKEQVQKWRSQLPEEMFNDTMRMKGWQMDGERIIYQVSIGVRHDYDDPGLRRELVKLQLLDALTAQGDRHGGNYLIRQDENGKFTGLSAIDNDQAFGTLVKDPNQLNWTESRVGGFQGVALPPVVDEQIKTAFNKMSDEQLRGSLTGLLPEAEINTAIERLHVIKDYLNNPNAPPPTVLEGSGPEHWGTETVGGLLSDKGTSYVGRDLYGLGNLDQQTNFSGTVKVLKEDDK